MSNIGYVRTSTKDQCLDRQLIAMKAAGVDERNIFTEQQSGKDFNRKEYRKMMRTLKKGDILFIKSIDRLGRNYEEIIEQWKKITRKIGANIVVLDMPLLDTRALQDSLKNFIAELVLQIMSYMAEEERKMILSRSREGIDAAKKRGVRFGRPSKKNLTSFRKVYADYTNHTITAKEAATRLNISPSTFYKWAREENDAGSKH